MLLKNIIFFDDHCNLCKHTVDYLKKIDKNKIFFFKSIRSKTFQEIFSTQAQYFSALNTLILLERENKNIWIRSKAVFRILWLLQGKWKFLGWMYIFPAFFLDWIYKYVARHRHKFIKKKSFK